MFPKQQFIFPTIFLSLLLIGNFLTAQTPNNYAVEVGAFDKKVQLNYFDKMPNSKVYEVVDLNEIYRYWIDCKDKTSAENLRQEAIQNGFINARIIDFKVLEEHCKNTCEYSRPQTTNRGTDRNTNNTTDRTNNNTNDDRNKNSLSSKLYTDAATPSDDNYKIPTNEDFVKEDKTTKTDWNKNPVFDINKDKIECLFYDYKSPYLRAESKKELDKVATLLLQNKNYTVKVFAHTDGNGGDDFNYKLSETRAIVVHKYLIFRGIEDKRIVDGPYGERHPIAKNEMPDGTDAEEGRQYNRRVELEIYDAAGQKINVVNPIIVPERLKISE